VQADRHHTPPEIRRVAVERILPLRQEVLRSGMSIGSACFDGDAADGTLHLAALAGDQVVACASFMRNTFAGEPAYQLRGMATHPAWRGLGLGRRLLSHGEALLRDDPIRLRWCNARSSAIGFYLRQGWVTVSEEFDIPTAGPHRRMTRRA
jgi:predicted GNAT family N-acyltransferase